MKRLAALALLATLCAGVCIAQNDTPLGDVAKKKSGVKAKRVVTDEDLPSSSIASTPAAPEKPASAVPTEAELAAPAVPATNDDGTLLTPEQKLSAMEQRVSKLKDYENSLEKHLKQVAEKLENEPSEFRRNMYTEALQRQAGTLESFKKQRTELEGAIAQLKSSQPADDKASQKESSTSSDSPTN